MKLKHAINDDFLTLGQLHALLTGDVELILTDQSRDRILKCRSFLDEKSFSNLPVYGINTGFGSLCDKRINTTDLEELQKNLVMSHACGMGDEVPKEIVKIMLFLKIQSLSYGHSGVQLSTVERLVSFYNHNILPIVFQQGSLGASGDLALSAPFTAFIGLR